jgi:nucleoside-diphosphate-sugar epimerase
MASGDLILLTGATGFLGFRVLVDALKAGYRVRAAVRNPSKVQNVLKAPSIKALKPTEEQLSWVTVKDMTAPGAYDDAVKGAKYAIHVASPIPSFGGKEPTAEEYETYFVKAAQAATIGLLESAKKAGTVKRVVITSSVVANIPFEYFLGQGEPADRVFNSDDRIPLAKGPYRFEFEAYSASKAGALNASEAWVKNEKPGLDIISILPGWIFGRDELVTTASGLKSESTNSVLINLLAGGKSDIPNGGNSVLVDDVAQIHIQALDSSIQGNTAYFAQADGVDGMIWEDGLEVIKREFPQAVKDGSLSAEGKQPTILLKVDASKTEKTFGIKFAGFEEQVRSVAAQYLDLLAKA